MRIMTEPVVELKVTDTAAPQHASGGGGGLANILKEASLENGLTTRVPIFIKSGDLVRIDTRSKDYLGKAAR